MTTIKKSADSIRKVSFLAGGGKVFFRKDMPFVKYLSDGRELTPSGLDVLLAGGDYCHLYYHDGKAVLDYL